jgi:hypothetical protein
VFIRSVTPPPGFLAGWRKVTNSCHLQYTQESCRSKELIGTLLLRSASRTLRLCSLSFSNTLLYASQLDESPTVSSSMSPPHKACTKL